MCYLEAAAFFLRGLETIYEYTEIEEVRNSCALGEETIWCAS